jgi:hypothetical protein
MQHTNSLCSRQEVVSSRMPLQIKTLTNMFTGKEIFNKTSNTDNPQPDLHMRQISQLSSLRLPIKMLLNLIKLTMRRQGSQSPLKGRVWDGRIKPLRQYQTTVRVRYLL